MNGKQKKAAKYDKLVMAASKPMTKEIFLEKNRYIVASVDYYRRNGGFSETLAHDHAAALKSIYSKYYAIIIRAINIIIRDELKLKNPDMEFKALSPWDRMLKKWIDNNAGQKAMETARTTQEDIKRAAQKAFEGGEDEESVLESMMRSREMSVWRSSTIARTEMSMAAMYASTETAKGIQSDIGVPMLKFWVPVSDDRTREDHADMLNSEGIPLDAMFEVGGERLPAPTQGAIPENNINCRCQLVYELSV